MKKNKKENIQTKNLDNKDKKLKINDSLKIIILSIILIAIFCIAISPVTLQNDTFYTIKVGEHISEYGIDNKDSFSWHEGLDYTYPHWVYDLVTYNIYSTFGMTGIYVTTCMLSVMLGLSIYIVNTKLLKNKLTSFVITIGAMYLLNGYIAARAQLPTFILFIWTIYFIEKFIQTKNKRYALGLITIPILIANLHVAVFPFYFVLYLPYIAEYFIIVIFDCLLYRKIKIMNLKSKIVKLMKKNGKEEIIEKLKQDLKELEEKNDTIKIKRTKTLQNPYKIKLEKKDNVKWLILILIICIFTGFLTPLGTTPYTYLVKTMQSNTTENINEHLPMVLANNNNIITTLTIFFIILIFTVVKIRLCDLFMFGGLVFLMLMSRRQESMFVIICSVILNRLLIQFLNWKEDVEYKKMLKIAASKIGMIIIILLALGFSYYIAKDKFNDKYVDESVYPIDASTFILENVDLGNARFYNEYNYGSYLIFRGIPVFVDSRADLYAPEFSGKEEDIFMDFIETSGISKFYGDIFEKYDITHVITYKNSKVNMIIQKTQEEDYEKLYEDKYFVVYKILSLDSKN